MKTNNKPIVAVDPGVGGGFAVNPPEGIVLFKMPESLPDICALKQMLIAAFAMGVVITSAYFILFVIK